MACRGCSTCTCCCCCCGKRGATVTFALIGLLLAAGVIAPPLYVYMTDQNYAKLFPVIKYGRIYLAQMTGGEPHYTTPQDPGPTVVSDAGRIIEQSTVSQQQTPGQTYKLAIFQLLDDTERMAPCLAFFSFCMGCINVPLDLLLLGGALFRKACPLMPWLVITLLEHLVVGVPLIVFFGLISLYLAAQLQLYIVAAALIGTVLVTFFLSLTSWFTVHACYTEFNNGNSCDYGTSDHTLTQPLLTSNHSSGPPPLPPGHPAASQNGGGYHLGQYPQYYPPHSGQSRQLPSAPPGGHNGIYPQLPNA